MSKDRNDVKEILEKLSKSGNSSETEFTFESQQSSGLVFEFVREEDLAVDSSETVKEQTAPEQIKEEFTLPDVFEVSEKYNTDSTPDVQLKMWTTYVPRFTEVSDTYRMIGDTRPRSGGVPAPTPEIIADEPDEQLDPTADGDETVSGAVMVDMSRPSVEDNDTLSVYKFSDKEEVIEFGGERTLDDERREIADLIRLTEPEGVAEHLPETLTESESVTAEANEETNTPSEPKVYTIPDPVDDEVGAVEFSNDKVEPVEDLPETLKRIGKDKSRSKEFAMPAERDSFKDRFLDGLMSLKIRFGASLLFSLLLCLFETLTATGVIEDSLLGIPMHRTAHAVIDLLLASASLLLALPEIIRAVKLLIFKRVVPEIMLLVSYLVLLLYTVVIVAGAGLIEYPLFGFMFSILNVSAILAAHCRLDADFSAFKQISKSKEKQVLDKKKTRTLTEENLALDGLIDEYKSRTARVFRAGFITDFFARAAKVSEKSKHTLVMLAITGGVSLVTGVASFFLSGMHLIPAMSAFTFVFLMGLPAFALLSHKLPYYHSQLCALAEDSAVIGEPSLVDFAKTDVITFEDTEIFGPDDVNLKRFMLYGDRDNMEKAMQQMCSLFSVAGGPLNFIFAGALDNRVRRSPAENPIIEEDGLSGDVGGHRIAAGSEEYMIRHGILIPEGSNRSDAGIDTTKVMYAAEDGEVYAKFYIRYSLSEEFTMLLPALREEGIIPLVYTRDPNVSNELIKKLMAGSDCMRVVKKLTPHPGEDKLYNRLSASVITYGDKINAINLILLAKRYKKLSDRLAMSEIYAMGVGIVLAVVLTLLGMKGVPSAIFGLWQIAWCVVLHFVSRNSLIKDSDEHDSEDNK